jgi:UPF0176 protein
MSEQYNQSELARQQRLAKKAARRAQMESMKIDPNAPRIPYVVLLFYKYVNIENPQQWANEHLKWCRENGIKGRILVAKIGINGTCAGPRELMEKYKQKLTSDPRFADVMFKEDIGDQFTFTKIFVRVRDELVTLKIPGVKAENGGVHLPPEDFNKMIENDPDVVLVDMRNKYEYDLGRFKGAVALEMNNFKELPQAVDQIEHLKDKKILAYCTGGIRCETGTAYLKMRGFKNVYQLEGGIHNYGQKSPDKHWEGKMFVFDRRVAVPINKTQDQVISTCLHCAEECDVYINCVNASCNALFICCESCAAKMENACSEECQKHQRDPNEKDYMSMLQRRYASKRESEIINH